MLKKGMSSHATDLAVYAKSSSSFARKQTFSKKLSCDGTNGRFTAVTLIIDRYYEVTIIVVNTVIIPTLKVCTFNEQVVNGSFGGALHGGIRRASIDRQLRRPP